MQRLDIATVTIAVLMFATVEGRVVAGEAGANADIYVGVCKLPEGFRLESCQTDEPEGELVRHTTWKLDAENKLLLRASTATLRRAEGYTPARVVEEFAVRQDGEIWQTINFRSVTCQDAKTLDLCQKLMLERLAEPVRVEIIPAVAGERTWVTKDAKFRIGASLWMGCRSGLKLLMVDVTARDRPNVEQLQNLATTVLKETLASNELLDRRVSELRRCIAAQDIQATYVAAKRLAVVAAEETARQSIRKLFDERVAQGEEGKSYWEFPENKRLLSVAEDAWPVLEAEWRRLAAAPAEARLEEKRSILLNCWAGIRDRRAVGLVAQFAIDKRSMHAAHVVESISGVSHGMTADMRPEQMEPYWTRLAEWWKKVRPAWEGEVAIQQERREALLRPVALSADK